MYFGINTQFLFQCRQSTIAKNIVELVFVNDFNLHDEFDENLIREFKKLYYLQRFLSENIKIIGKLPFTWKVIVL